MAPPLRQGAAPLSAAGDESNQRRGRGTCPHGCSKHNQPSSLGKLGTQSAGDVFDPSSTSYPGLFHVFVSCVEPTNCSSRALLSSHLSPESCSPQRHSRGATMQDVKWCPSSSKRKSQKWSERSRTCCATRNGSGVVVHLCLIERA